jgi:hypothetical protein
MNENQNNSLSRIERDYALFLYDNAKRSTNQTVKFDDILVFIQTPEGKKGIEAFKTMRKPVTSDSMPMPVGAFL